MARSKASAHTPLEEQLIEAVRNFIGGMRETYGTLASENGDPYQGHRIGCECGVCRGMLLLALAEGGGRCVICGCTDDDACEEGCSWSDEQHFVCSVHPSPVRKAALRLAHRISKELHRG